MSGAGDRFRILSVDGGGIRGLIPSLVLQELEERVRREAGERRGLSDCFHLMAGTSTGGLIALGLTAPDASGERSRLGAADLVRFYTEQGPRIFHAGLNGLLSLGGWLGPKYSPATLERVLRETLGEVRLRDAVRDVVVTSYDMRRREPHFFKRWRAAESGERNPQMVDAALATAAAPTYFPSHGLDDRALVDGGVFASNPTVAAIAEALKRAEDEPADLHPQELLVVSLGTGVRESGFEQREVRRWGKVGWIRPRSGEPALIGAVLDGQSDAADHWAHMILNHDPGDPFPDADEIGANGPRYFRLQTRLETPLGLDDASPAALEGLAAAARRLIDTHDHQLTEIAGRLARHERLPRDPA
ncbi:MAG: patatin-like phospholipase family protein [Solirubrobacterales bacterium]